WNQALQEPECPPFIPLLDALPYRCQPLRRHPPRGLRSHDADAIVVRRGQLLAHLEQLLVELLAGPQTGVGEPDVGLRLEAREPDHLAREVLDPHRLAQLEGADL